METTKPIYLFVLLLVILVVSVLFGNAWKKLTKETTQKQEGLIGFSESNNSGDKISISQYSKNKVYKLFDNLFYDDSNGNLIEIDGAPTVMKTTTPTPTPTTKTPGITLNANNAGNKIDNIYVTDRNGKTHESFASTAVDIQLQYPNNISNTVSAFSYTTKSKQTDTYQVFYIPYLKNTFIQINNVTKGKLVYSFCFINGTHNEHSFISNGSFPAIPTLSQPSTVAVDPANDTFIVYQKYSTVNGVYQITPTVFFDAYNGNLIIEDSTVTQGFTVYNRDGNKVTDFATSLPKTITAKNKIVSWTKAIGQYLVCYSAINKVTAVSVFKNGAVANVLDIVDIVTFDETTYQSATKKVSGNITAVSPMTTPGSFGVGTSGSAYGHPPITQAGTGTDMSEYWKWFWYWNTVSNESPQGSTVVGTGPKANHFTNDYLLKTQIVPSVCPGCQTCNNNTSSPSLFSYDDVPTPTPTPEPKKPWVNEPTVQKSNDTNIMPTRNLATTSTRNQPTTSTQNLATTSTQNQPTTATQNPVRQPPTATTNPIDNYSYYGALVPKGGDYVPVTNDFSAFRK
jgi:hypothetical protein